MKYSTKLSDTIHILIFIALGDDEQLSSTKIAESIKTNPAYVRQLMATLKNAGIVVNTQGHANAALAKSADKINMYDIYRAVEGDKPLLHLDTDTNPDCGIFHLSPRIFFLQFLNLHDNMTLVLDVILILTSKKIKVKRNKKCGI